MLTEDHFQGLVLHVLSKYEATPVLSETNCLKLFHLSHWLSSPCSCFLASSGFTTRRTSASIAQGAPAQTEPLLPVQGSMFCIHVGMKPIDYFPHFQPSHTVNHLACAVPLPTPSHCFLKNSPCVCRFWLSRREKPMQGVNSMLCLLFFWFFCLSILMFSC